MPEAPDERATRSGSPLRTKSRGHRRAGQADELRMLLAAGDEMRSRVQDGQQPALARRPLLVQEVLEPRGRQGRIEAVRHLAGDPYRDLHRYARLLRGLADVDVGHLARRGLEDPFREARIPARTERLAELESRVDQLVAVLVDQQEPRAVRRLHRAQLPVEASQVAGAQRGRGGERLQTGLGLRDVALDHASQRASAVQQLFLDVLHAPLPKMHEGHGAQRERGQHDAEDGRDQQPRDARFAKLARRPGLDRRPRLARLARRASHDGAHRWRPVCRASVEQWGGHSTARRSVMSIQPHGRPPEAP
jgi:hypothetical protein